MGPKSLWSSISNIVKPNHFKYLTFSATIVMFMCWQYINKQGYFGHINCRQFFSYHIDNLALYATKISSWIFRIFYQRWNEISIKISWKFVVNTVVLCLLRIFMKQTLSKKRLLNKKTVQESEGAQKLLILSRLL